MLTQRSDQKINIGRNPTETETAITNFSSHISAFYAELENSFQNQMREYLKLNDTSSIAKCLSDLCLKDYTGQGVEESPYTKSEIKFILKAQSFLNQFYKTVDFTSLNDQKKNGIKNDITDREEGKTRYTKSLVINRELKKVEKKYKSMVNIIVADRKSLRNTPQLLHKLCNEKYEVKNKQGEVVFTVDLSTFLSNYYNSDEFKKSAGIEYGKIRSNLDRLAGKEELARKKV